MFTLVTDKSKYFRVKCGQTAADVERNLKTPVHGAVYGGKIIVVCKEPLKQYVATVGDTYRTVALKFGADEERIKSLNGNKPVYPTCKLFVPCK